MFGSGGITSSWGQPQQNQQQGSSAFGQPATTGFGTGSGACVHSTHFELPYNPDTQHSVLEALLVNSNHNSNHKPIQCLVTYPTLAPATLVLQASVSRLLENCSYFARVETFSQAPLVPQIRPTQAAYLVRPNQRQASAHSVAEARPPLEHLPTQQVLQLVVVSLEPKIRAVQARLGLGCLEGRSLLHLDQRLVSNLRNTDSISNSVLTRGSARN